jgi:hypothetical protein
LEIIFLASLDPEQYKPEIECLLEILYSRQKDHGGWGYSGRDTGDTSMTQYGVLCCWEAKQEGFNVPTPVLEKVAKFLLGIQDPGGGFAYQSLPVPESVPLEKQSDVRHCMTLAGGGCLYILTDLFQFELVPKKKGDLPSALKEAQPKQEVKTVNPLDVKINPRKLRESQLLTNEWFKQNFVIEVPYHYQYYYLYTLERYMSFRDLIEHNSDKEAKWYNDGVDYIIKHQAQDGSLLDPETKSECGNAVDTAFAMLFLVRSTKKAIEKAKQMGSGVLVAGRGLPRDDEDLSIQNGRAVVKQQVGPADDLLKMFDEASDADYEKALEMMEALPSQQVEALLSAHGEKLRKLTREKSPDARMAAVVALGKTRDLDNVPALLYALMKDDDREVVIEAKKALERISRNPTGFGPKDENFTEEQRRVAVERWKAWYLSLRPDADVDF